MYVFFFLREGQRSRVNFCISYSSLRNDKVSKYFASQFYLKKNWPCLLPVTVPILSNLFNRPLFCNTGFERERELFVCVCVCEKEKFESPIHLGGKIGNRKWPYHQNKWKSWWDSQPLSALRNLMLLLFSLYTSSHPTTTFSHSHTHTNTPTHIYSTNLYHPILIFHSLPFLQPFYCSLFLTVSFLFRFWRLRPFTFFFSSLPMLLFFVPFLLSFLTPLVDQYKP